MGSDLTKDYTCDHKRYEPVYRIEKDEDGKETCTESCINKLHFKINWWAHPGVKKCKLEGKSCC